MGKIKIKIVSPSGAIDPEYIDRAAEVLRGWGYEVSESAHARGKLGRFSASDDDRVADLADALADPDVDMVLCARGGYGLQRIIDRIPPIHKPIIGFSDITALHLLAARTGQPTIHAPMCKGIKDEGLRSVLDKGLRIKDKRLNSTGDAGVSPAVEKHYTENSETKVISPSSFILHPASSPILFIEDVGERHYHIDRMMNNLRLSGVLANISGLIVGQFSDCEDDPSMGCTVYETIRHAVEPYHYPVVFNFPAGHVEENMPLYLNAPVEIDVREDYSSSIHSFFKSS